MPGPEACSWTEEGVDRHRAAAIDFVPAASAPAAGPLVCQHRPPHRVGRLVVDILRRVPDACIRRGWTAPSLNLDPPRRYEDFARWQRETFRPGHPAYGDGLLWWIDHVLAATYPDRPAYRRALLACVRAAPSLPPFAKRLVGLTLRGLFNVRRPPQTDLSLQRAETVSELDPAEGMLTVNLAPETSRRLTELGRNVGASHFAIWLAAYAGLIAAETGSESVAFGTHSGSRSPRHGARRDRLLRQSRDAAVALRPDPDVSTVRHCPPRPRACGSVARRFPVRNPAS